MKLDLVDATGNRRALESAKELGPNTRMGVQKALYFVGKDLQSEFNRQVLAKGKTGRIYIRRIKGGARRRHRASAPGETPANRTGNYRRNIGFKVQGWRNLVFGNSAKYAGYLEKGTRRMKPRPGLANTIKASERNIIRHLAEKIEGEV